MAITPDMTPEQLRKQQMNQSSQQLTSEKGPFKGKLSNSSSSSLSDAIVSHSDLFVRQKKEWGEILVGFESQNKYAVMDQHKNIIGMVTERGSGLLNMIVRLVARSHRPLQIDVFDISKNKVLFHLSRKFFFFFSDLYVSDGGGQLIGSLHRRFGLIYKKYDLIDANGQVFAIWRLWHFPVLDSAGNEVASISKKWGGVMREMFTDADTFRINFGEAKWSDRQRAVIFAASISIDFDFFEDNSNRSGVIDF